ncbi:MAG: hypothetical protein ACAI35_05125, partial [Candidatus Methylacidiphilales bacterium]
SKAESGNAEAQFQLGVLYDKPDDSSSTDDLKQALYWYEKAAAQQFPKAAEYAGYLLIKGMAGKIETTQENGTKVAKTDHARALKWLLPESEAGSAFASELIGTSYLRGQGVDPDTTKALQFMERGAGQGSAECMFRMGYAYANAQGRPRDNAKAIEFFRKGAEAGNSSCCACLGTMAWAGRGMPQDYAIAKQWFERAMACRGGNSWAPYMLGLMSENGQGSPRDMKQAVHFYKEAAAGRYYYAKIRCSLLHAAGTADIPDYQDDINWALQGAETGNPLNQFALGHGYLQGRKAYPSSDGQSLPQSDRDALIWLSLSAADKLNMVAATELCSTLRKRLPAEDLRVADERIAELRSKFNIDEVPLF